MSKCTLVAIPVALDDRLDVAPVVRVVPGKVPSRRHLVPGAHRAEPVAPVVQVNADLLETHTQGEDALPVAPAPARSSVSPPVSFPSSSCSPSEPKSIATADWSQTPSPLQFMKRRLSDGSSFGILRTLSPSLFAKTIAVASRPPAAALPARSADTYPETTPTSATPFAPEPVDRLNADTPRPVLRPVPALPNDDADVAAGHASAQEFAETETDATAGPLFTADDIQDDDLPVNSGVSPTPSWVLTARTDVSAPPLPWSPAILLGALLALRDCALWSWNAIRRVRPFSRRSLLAAAWALTCPPLLAAWAYTTAGSRPLLDQIILVASVFFLAPMVAGLAWAATMALGREATRLASSLVARGRRFVA